MQKLYRDFLYVLPPFSPEVNILYSCSTIIKVQKLSLINNTLNHKPYLDFQFSYMCPLSGSGSNPGSHIAFGWPVSLVFFRVWQFSVILYLPWAWHFWSVLVFNVLSIWMCLEFSHDYRYIFGKSATEVMSYLISASHQGYVMSRFLITGGVHCDLLVKVIC